MQLVKREKPIPAFFIPELYLGTDFSFSLIFQEICSYVLAYMTSNSMGKISAVIRT